MLFVLVLLANSVVYAVMPDSWALGVQRRQQEKSLWCWTASATSILHYHGKNITQSAFAIRVHSSTANRGATDSQVRAGLHSYGLSSTLTSTVGFDRIQYEVFTIRRPLYAGYSYKQTSGGHAVVIDGFDVAGSGWVRYMDPGNASYIWRTYISFRDNSVWVWDGTLYNMTKNSNW